MQNTSIWILKISGLHSGSVAYRNSVQRWKKNANLVVQLDGLVNNVFVALLEPQMFAPARLNKSLRAADTEAPGEKFKPSDRIVYMGCGIWERR